MPFYRAFITNAFSQQVTDTKGPIEANNLNAAYDQFISLWNLSVGGFYVRKSEPPLALAAPEPGPERTYSDTLAPVGMTSRKRKREPAEIQRRLNRAPKGAKAIRYRCELTHGQLMCLTTLVKLIGDFHSDRDTKGLKEALDKAVRL